MRPSNTDLYDLVSTLSQGEKNFVSRAIGKKTTTAKLYNLIIQVNKPEDDQLIRQLFKTDSGKKKNQFSVLKNKLYDEILLLLNNYHQGDSKFLQLLNMLQSINLLYTRYMFDACIRMINKAEKIAIDYEYEPILMEILIWKLRVQDQMGQTSRNTTVLDDIHNAFSRFNTYINLGRLTTAIAISGNKSLGLRSKERQEYLTQLFNQAKKEQEKSLESFKKWEFYYSIKAIYCRLLEDYKGSFENWSRILELYQQHPRFAAEDPVKYIIRCTNRLIVTTGVFEPERVFREARENRQRLQKLNIPKIHPVFQHAYAVSYFTELEAMINYGLFSSGVDKITEIQKEFSSVKIQLSTIDQLKMYFMFAYAEFGKGNYRNALGWINKYMNLPFSKLPVEFQLTARIINIIIHFELQNYQLTISRIKATSRWLNQSENPYEMERLLLKYLDKLIDIRTKTELMELLTTLRDEMKQLLTRPYEKNALTWFDIITWLDSKIENRSFAEMVQEKRGSVNHLDKS